jgi:mRNA-degrading endonuclease RelE of RelBE toxin-antitoxin system
VESKWRVELTKPAQAGLDQLREEYGDEAYFDALDTLLALEDEPEPPEAKELENTRSEYRIYLYRSLYRAIYRLIRNRHVVLVTRVGPRGEETYKGHYEKW